LSAPISGDERHMREAIELAARGRYSTSPNPAVGCVLVKDGAVIARGYHRRAGEPHAEIEALRAATSDPRGATAFVSLEPCNHHGRTPPCSEALIEAGIERVVYAESDPNPRVNGSGAARLRAAGIEVVGGVASELAVDLNRGFFMRMRERRPRVRVKLAMSIDGGAALANGQSQWITGPAARADVQRLRAESCAIVTGIGTVLADDPALNVRDPAFEMPDRQPRRVVLDSDLKMPDTARILALPGATLVFCAEAALARASALQAAGAEIEALPLEGDKLSLAALLTRLAALEVNELLVEAGPTLAAAFLRSGFTDQLILYIAPKLLGIDARRALALSSPTELAQAEGFVIKDSLVIGDDLRVILEPRISTIVQP
jgi:diaminohydroxyphosphoribosylaminopyrimidine deaminase / 5-amino-6-(5-phosphoribosylamino)uracil reductase